MRAVITSFPTFLRIALAVMFQYRWEMLLWAIWGVVYPAVAMAMWRAALAGTGGAAQIGGFGEREFAGYFLLTMIIGHLCTAWDVYEMGYLVRSGGMSPKLLRPILPIWENLAANVAFKLLTTGILLPIWAGIAIFVAPRVSTDAGDLAAGALATVLASGINFLWGYLLAMTAFWFTRSEAVGQLWFGAQLFFGGRLAPLTILPEPLQWAAAAMPFKWIVWFPAAVLLGNLDREQILAGLAWQTAWLTGGVLLFRVVWRAGLRRYSAVGA
ncbi:MAG: ABC transporter permease [Planctomycetota bacterium]|nr:MAG: ABC transporter permease [Planctomycetota bacterium]